MVFLPLFIFFGVALRIIKICFPKNDEAPDMWGWRDIIPYSHLVILYTIDEKGLRYSCGMPIRVLINI